MLLLNIIITILMFILGISAFLTLIVMIVEYSCYNKSDLRYFKIIVKQRIRIYQTKKEQIRIVKKAMKYDKKRFIRL